MSRRVRTSQRGSRWRWLWFLPSLAVLLWTIPSLNRTFGWQTGTASGKPFTVFVGYGTLIIAWGPARWARPGDTTFGHYMNDGVTYWDLGKRRAFWWRPHHFGGQLFIPLWLIAVMVAIPPGWFEYRRRTRRPPGSCKTCGYDRTGLEPEARCPECGGTRINV